MKNKFVKSTLILLIGGMFTKILGMFIKIVSTRLLGTEGIGIYMLIMPTFSLFISLAQFGMPIAISKLVAEDKKNNKNLVFSSIPISLIVNFLIMIFLLFFSKYISNNLLHEPRCFEALMCIGFVLPFISISSILRGYFFGKQKMWPHVISNVTEDFVRLIIIMIGVPIFLMKGINYAIAFVILSNIVSELTSIFVLFFFLPKNFKITKKDIKPDISSIKDTLNISIPSTGSRLIGSLGYFFEPIILTNVLLGIGYNNGYIVNEYGILSGYVMPLLTLPSFFTLAISQALIPVISNSYSNHKYEYTNNKIKQAIIFSLLIGIPVTMFFIIKPELPLNFIYNTNEGITYIKVMAPIFLLHYIQSPISSSLQAKGYANISMKGTFYGIILRTASLFLFSNLKIGLWGLVIATSINILFVTCYDGYNVYKILKNYIK